MKNKTLLILENEDSNKELLTDILQKEYNIISAENCVDAMALLRIQGKRISAVVIDAEADDENVMDFLETYARNELYDGIPVIVSTDKDDSEFIENCFKYGVMDFVMKPYIPEVIKRRVTNIIQVQEKEAKAVIKTIGNMFYGIYVMDIQDRTYQEITALDNLREYFGRYGSSSKGMRILTQNFVDEKYIKEMRDFMNLKTMAIRLENKRSISIIYEDKVNGWTEAIIIPADTEDDGELTKVILVFRNVTEDKKTEITLSMDNSLYNAAVGTIYRLGIVINLTKEIYRIVNYTNRNQNSPVIEGRLDQLITVATMSVPEGEHVSNYLRCFSIASMKAARERGEKEIVLEHQQFDEYGNLHWMESRLVFLDNTGGDDFAIALSRNIDDKMRLELALKEEVAIIETLNKDYSDIFIVDLESNISYSYKVNGRIIDRPYENLREYDTGIEIYTDKYVIEEDRESTKRFFDRGELLRSFDGEIDREHTYRVEYQGKVHYFHAKISSVYLNQNLRANAVMGFSMIDEIVETEMKRNEDLQARQTKLELIVKAARTVYSTIVEQNLTKDEVIAGYCENEEDCYKCIGNSIDWYVNFEAAKIVNENHRQKYVSLFNRDALLKVYNSKKKMVSCRVQMIRRGEIHWVDIIGIALKSVDDSIYSIVLVKDIEDEIRRGQELKDAQEKAERDPLTGLYNKGAFAGKLSRCIKNNVAVLIIDIDHFKNVNDTYGHAVGDETIKFIANALKDSVRTSDYVARVGGDEFAIIMESLRGEDKKKPIANKLKNLMKVIKIHEDDIPDVTLSIGVAMVDPEIHLSADDVYRDADSALYEVKQNGRNGFAFFNNETN